LEYTGIIQEHGKGIKSSMSEVGTRYLINLGCMFSQESSPSSSALPIARNITSKKMTEFGMNNPSFKDLIDKIPDFVENDMSVILENELDKSIDVLDLSSWIRDTLRTININTVKDILSTTETYLKTAYYVGEKRARLVKSAATASVYEYLNG
jgi:DNA-directed RNA polymerase alpha subunit